MERKTFIFYRSFYDSIKDLESKDFECVFRAICEYALNGNEIDLKGVPKAIFTLIKPSLDVSIKNYLNGSKPKAKFKPNESEIQANNKRNESETQANTEPIRNKDKDKYKEYKEKDSLTTIKKENESSTDFLSVFLSLYEIKPDVSSLTVVRDLDFAKVLKAWGESKWLKEEIKSLRWVVNNYNKIINGEYKDKAKGVKVEDKEDERPVPEGKPADYWQVRPKMLEIIKNSYSGKIFDPGVANLKGLKLDYITQEDLPITIASYKQWNGIRD